MVGPCPMFVFFICFPCHSRDRIWILPFLAFFLVCIRRILRYYFILMMSSSSLQIASEKGDAMWMSTKRVGHRQERCGRAESGRAAAVMWVPLFFSFCTNNIDWANILYKRSTGRLQRDVSKLSNDAFGRSNQQNWKIPLGRKPHAADTRNTYIDAGATRISYLARIK